MNRAMRRSMIAVTIVGSVLLWVALATLYPLVTLNRLGAEARPPADGPDREQLPPEVVTFVYSIHNNGYIEPCG